MAPEKDHAISLPLVFGHLSSHRPEKRWAGVCVRLDMDEGRGVGVVRGKCNRKKMERGLGEQSGKGGLLTCMLTASVTITKGRGERERERESERVRERERDREPCSFSPCSLTRTRHGTGLSNTGTSARYRSLL